jgi:phosphatidylserine/phosphatidylglycerophosphate/cardiolipin synthase-like enzyme
MKRALLRVALVISLALAVCQPAVLLAAEDWAVYFSPQGGCTAAIVQAVGKARSTILVQAYSFTSRLIAQALKEAQARGVKVQVILDKSQVGDRSGTLNTLVQADIPTFIDAAHSIAHKKIIIIDGEIVITGSFNFTRNAEERNAENLLIIPDKALAARYEENWRQHQAHSRPHGGGN